jgi:phosphoglycerol transferase MdoB-like AlkP superfamily enzyme
MKNTYRRWVPSHLRFLVTVHLILLGIFSIFRYVTLLYNRPSWLFALDSSSSVGEAFKIGLGFDITVANYALMIPYLLMTAAYLWDWNTVRLFKVVRWYCGAVILLSLIICAADVPYFNFYNSRLNTAAVHWKNNSIIVKFLLSDVKYYPFMLILVAGVWGIGRLVRTVWDKTWAHHHSEGNHRNRLAASFLAFLLLLTGMWGGAMPKTPDMKNAYFSDNGFVNQLTLNPVHTWFDSYFDFDINLFSKEQAISKVQSYYGITKPAYPSPIARKHSFAEPARKMNVVLVLMESMSADRMGIFGNTKNLTPGLDSIARNSVFFNNCYSNGIHTNAGLYSSIFGMPIMMLQHPMYNGVSEYGSFTGLPQTLKSKGYSTSFFCTHPKTFDNLDVFMPKNGFEYLSDQFDYPAEKVANSWGVGDESLFEHAINTFDSLDANTDKPFFGTVLTISSHPPFTLPSFTQFKPRSSDQIEIAFEYADWSIKNFLDNCSKKSWYENTIFVFVGDHGVNIPAAYNFDVPLSYNHVPLIIHAPGLFKQGEKRTGLANQTDIFPTIMGLLQQNYVQNTLGYDLFRENRPYAFFSQDHKLAVMDQQYLYVARKSGKEAMFDYRSGSGVDISKQHLSKMDSMRNYACAHLETANWLIEQKLTGPQK